MMTLLLAFACSGDSKESVESSTTLDSADTAVDDGCSRVEGATGTLALTFAMEADYIPTMDEPPVGTFRGSVFACTDATAVGPVDGAVALLDINVEAVDLQPDGGPTEVLFHSDALPSERVWVLGCLDTDANDCDKHDPVTKPSSNRVVVAPDVETPFNVFFGILNPS